MSQADRSLDRIRGEIDRVDSELVRLLSRRVELAQEVGRVKGRDGTPFFTPERERQIHDRLAEINPGPMSTRQLRAVFREIVSAARAAETPLTCAYWGPEGTFTHVAGIQTFGSSTEFVATDSIPEVFQCVERGATNYGVVPVENSVAGVVPQTLDQFPQTNVKIVAETYVPIAHHLVSRAASLAEIKRVYAFEQPRTQCRLWLKSHLPNVEFVDAAPTARAATLASDDPEGAAICNTLAAETVGIPILAEHIEDDPANRTRFLVLGYNEPARTGRDKTSIMFNVRNRPGELVKALSAFESNQVNLTMIESRPAQRATFEYLFYADCDGHQKDTNMQKALDTLRTLTLETTVLGSYPRRDPLDI